MEKSNMIAELIEKSFRTGSRAFGVEDWQSDDDYVIHEKDFHEITSSHNYEVDNTPNKEYGEDGKFFSYKIGLEKSVYNFIVAYDDATINAWKFATDQMLQMPKASIKNKETRVKIFELLKDLYYNEVMYGSAE